MDFMERGHISLRKVTKYWNIPLNSFFNHMNGRIRCRKLGPQGVPTKQKDEAMVTWILKMKKARLYATLQ